MTTSTTGWAAAILAAMTICLPYLVRILAKAKGGHPPRDELIRSHLVIGFVVLALSSAHMLASMTPTIIGSAASPGIAVATAALVFVIIQVGFGLRLNASKPDGKRNSRRLHIVGMLAIVVAVAIHIAINSPLLSRS
ncbi:MAG: hypothetical protein KDE14_11735 [Rhodobacteraceae bacterium]|nr:hypothetical protein [Paracoccaceae bacterium]